MSSRTHANAGPPVSTLPELAAHIAADEAVAFDTLPDRDLVSGLMDRLVSLLFPDGRGSPRTAAQVADEFDALHAAFVPVLRPLEGTCPTPRTRCATGSLPSSRRSTTP